MSKPLTFPQADRRGRSPAARAAKAKTKKPRTTKPKPNSRADAAFAIYRDMGFDRSLARLLPVLQQEWGERAPSYRGILEWSTKYNWQERLEAFEREAAAREQAAVLAYMAREAPKRRRARLQTYLGLREFGVKAIIDAERMMLDERGQMVPNPNYGRARDPRTVHPAVSAAAIRAIQVADHGERLDLGESGGRDDQAGGADGLGLLPPPTVLVAGPDTLTELRDLVNRLPEPSLRALPQDVIDQVGDSA